jgi:flavin reductase (DIM6/NTAB) family NADH-FMN oxidoreductase RutF
VGFATQASIDPPRLLVCLSIQNATFETAGRATHLGVHLIPRDRIDLAELFGGETGDDVDKFARCRWEEGREGEPLLLDCPMRLSGRILDRHPFGDHVGYLLERVATWAHERFEPLDIRRASGIDPGHAP